MSGQVGRSGRLPKPAALKRIEGNPGKRPLRDDVAGIGRPVLPPALSELELFLWHATVAAVPPGILSAADSAILEIFACAWARFRQCQRQINATGLLVRGISGPVRNPLLVIQRQASAEMHAAGAALGLSPVARARLGGPAVEADKTMSWLLGEDPNLLN